MKKILLQFFLPLFLLIFSKVSIALPVGWNNALPIQVQNNSAVSVTNYQVQLTVNTQSLIALGQMNANGSDIRFGKDCSGNILFNYWIESGINTPNTVIWVKMDSLNSLETRTIYMFYNNPLAVAASAVNGTFFGPHSSTDSVASGAAGGVANSQRGFRFSANETILVTDFGKRVPNATTRYVTLFNFLTQAIVAQMEVAGPAAQYSYGSLPNPIWLQQGVQYVLEVFQGPADNSYYFGTSSQIGQHLTYYDMKYCNACTQNTFPTSTLTNYHYGYPDFWYYTKTNLPTAPTVTVGAGGGGVTFTATPSAVCLGGTSVLAGIGAATYIWQPGNFNGNPYNVSPLATTTYTVTGTTANGCVVTSTITVTVNPFNTGSGSATPGTICLGDNTVINASATPICAGNVNDFAGIYAPGNWAFSVVNSNGTVNTAGAPANIIISSGNNNSGTPGTTNYTIPMCTGTATVEVTVNPAPAITATATPATTCTQTVVTPSASGAPTIAWSGGVTNNIPFIANATTTYTVTGTDGIGCTGSTTVLVTVNPMSGILAPASSNQSQDHGDDFNVNYYDASCDLIATVDDGAGGNILGLTTSTVTVDPGFGVHNGQPFVRRWYQITPTNNGSADVVLYINQSDFDNYNLGVALPYLPLPTSGNNADPNISNIRITKNTDAGLGNSPVVITPTVNWNGTYWELSFNTPSFSQFRVHSVNPGNVPLPATVTNFSGVKLESSDKLSWTTSSEQNNAYFNLQHSTDGTTSLL
jgi:hypothetical protein